MGNILSHDGDLANIDALAEDVKTAWQTILDENVATIGESMRLINVFRQTGAAFAYNHPGNKLAAAVFYDGEASADADAVAKNVALQVAAMNPEYFSTDDVPQSDKDDMLVRFT